MQRYTKKEIEKKFGVLLAREINPYMQGRSFWSIQDANGNEFERASTLAEVVEKLENLKERW